MKKLPLLLQAAIFCIAVFLIPLQSAASKMPAFSLADVVSGETINSSSFEGKALLITFFATWCPPCLDEIPTLITLQDVYQAQGFSVIGLSVDFDNVKAVRKLMEKKSINYPVMMADQQTMENFGGVYGIPVSFLVSKKGNVVKKYTGYIRQSVLEKDLKKVL